jgi:hypothetical protein
MGLFSSCDEAPPEAGVVLVLVCRHLEAGLRNVEVRSGRYGKRKKISKAGVVKMMSLLDQRKHIVREEFRDLFIMLPSKELVTVTPYFMKVLAQN